MTARRDLLAVPGLGALPTLRSMEMQPARFDPVARRLSVSAHIGPGFADGRGLVRGGYFAALLDDVMTGAVLLSFDGAVEPRLVSQSLDYFEGAGPGDFAAEGWVMGVGDLHCLTRAELRGPSGTVAAVAQGVVTHNLHNFLDGG